jgi:hypothetical protein
MGKKGNGRRIIKHKHDHERKIGMEIHPHRWTDSPLLGTCYSFPFMTSSSFRLLSYTRTLTAQAKATVAPRRTVSPVERTQLRLARKQQADATLRQAQQQETTANATTPTTTSTQKPWDSRIVYGLGVGLPTFFLSWAIYDDQSPPAQLAQTLGITTFIQNIAQDFAKPSRPKLLPDWSQVRCSFLQI